MVVGRRLRARVKVITGPRPEARGTTEGSNHISLLISTAIEDGKASSSKMAGLTQASIVKISEGEGCMIRQEKEKHL